jgi:hypothetical protein
MKDCKPPPQASRGSLQGAWIYKANSARQSMRLGHDVSYYAYFYSRGFHYTVQFLDENTRKIQRFLERTLPTAPKSKCTFHSSRLTCLAQSPNVPDIISLSYIRSFYAFLGYCLYKV